MPENIEDRFLDPGNCRRFPDNIIHAILKRPGSARKLPDIFSSMKFQATASKIIRFLNPRKFPQNAGKFFHYKSSMQLFIWYSSLLLLDRSNQIASIFRGQNPPNPKNFLDLDNMLFLVSGSSWNSCMSIVYVLGDLKWFSKTKKPSKIHFLLSDGGMGGIRWDQGGLGGMVPLKIDAL